MKVGALVALLLVPLLRVDATDECGAVTIREWGGMVPQGVEFLQQPVDLVIIQHTVSQECTTDQQCEYIVRNMQWHFIMQLGWKNLPYSFLVGGNGKVYQGNGWLHVGSHTLGYNRRSIGIAFIGDFRVRQPTAAALRAAQNLISCGVNRNRLPRNYFLVGHSQLRPTESPGARLMQIIMQWPNWTRDVSIIPPRN